MCFNKEVSILTYIIGILSCYNLYKQDYKIEALFFLWVVQMQFIEYIFWLNPICNKTNKLLTKIAIILNHTQPLILYILLIYYNGKLPDYVHKLVLIFTIINIFYTIYDINKNDCSIVDNKISSHIIWEWNSYEYHTLFYILFIIISCILFYYIPNFNYNYHYSRNNILIFIYLISVIISYIIYSDKKSVGSMWCFAAALTPLILHFIYNYNKKLNY